MTNISYYYSKILKKLRGYSAKLSSIDGTAVIYSGTSISNSTVGRYTYIGYDCYLSHVTVGNFCSLSDHIFIGGAEHPTDWISTSPVFQNVKHSGPSKRFAKFNLPKWKQTIIGHDVWIGHGVTIKAGITIGNGAIIGSNAVVTKDVEPYSIVAGCPAKHIRYRFTQEIIDKLQTSKWWSFSDETLTEFGTSLNNPNEFIHELDLISNKCNK